MAQTGSVGADGCRGRSGAVAKSSSRKRLRWLQASLQDNQLVRLRRRQKGTGLLEGYVVAIGSTWLVLNLATGGEPDGWAVVRVDDVRDSDRWHVMGDRFVRRAFELGDAWPPAAPGMGLALDGGVRELIESAAAAFPLVSFSVEDDRPDISYIGQPVGWTAKKVRWRHLDINAEWQDDEGRYKLSDITRIDVGGRYETLLARVAGL